MKDKAKVHTPTPEQFQIGPEASEFYRFSQKLMKEAVARFGVDQAVSVVLSGYTRELRRHVSIEALQQMLHGLADTLPEAAKYDVNPEKPE